MRKWFIMVMLIMCLGDFAFAANKEGKIYGRVWIGTTPGINVKVVVYHDHWTRSGVLDRNKQIAATITSDKSGTANDGYYEIAGLPIDTKLMVVAIYSVFPKNPAVKRITLMGGAQKKVNLTIEKLLVKEPEPITITFPQIKIAKYNIEDISGALELTRDDLRNGKIEIRGRVNDGADGANTRKVEVDIGNGWQNTSGRTSWKYSFAPRDNYDYRVRIRAIDISGKEHKSLFGTIRLTYSGVDDEALIRGVVYGWEEACVNENLEGYMSYLANNYWYEDEGWDKDRERQAIKYWFDTYNSKRDMSNLKIRVSGNRATATYHVTEKAVNASTGVSLPEDPCNMYLKLRKINGKWLIEKERSNPR